VKVRDSRIASLLAQKRPRRRLSMFETLWCRLQAFVRNLFGGRSRRDKPRDEDTYQAKLTADRLLNNIGTGERQYTSEKLDIYLADVESTVDSFDLQLRLLRRYELGFPSIVHQETEPIPISIAGIFWPNWFVSEIQFEPFLEEFLFMPRRVWLEISGRLYENSGFKVELMEYEKTIQYLRRGLEQFLATRFSARRSDISQSPGLFFRVFTRRRGLRIHYSPSFFIEWRVFGSPTSPVGGWIQPGLYKFAAVGHRFPFTVDPGDYEIPPRTEAHLVNV
jgi:hypothetical protein